MGAGHGMVRFGQFGEQPLHFILLQRHIDLNRCVARDGRGNPSANLFQIQGLLLARNLIEQLVQHALYRCSVYPRRRNFYRDAAGPERFGLKAIVLQFVGNFRKDCLLRWRKLQHDWHQQPLALDSLRGTLLQDAFK